MRRRILAMCCSMLLVLGMAVVIASETKASDSVRMLDGSYLTDKDEAVGYATGKTRGEFLLNGYSKIVRLGPGEIYAGGTTMAAREVDKVKIGVMIERVKKEGDSWNYVDAWQEENLVADRISSTRRIIVQGDYYYRVRCVHSANGDSSSSFTNGIYIENP